jgi:hypothetical protein
MWGRMPLPSIPNCPQEPWEAQEEAHRDRSRVKFSFCERPGVETRQRESPESRDGAERLTPGPRTPDPRPELPSSEIWARHTFFFGLRPIFLRQIFIQRSGPWGRRPTQEPGPRSLTKAQKERVPALSQPDSRTHHSWSDLGGARRSAASRSLRAFSSAARCGPWLRISSVQ